MTLARPGHVTARYVVAREKKNLLRHIQSIIFVYVNYYLG